MIRIKGDLAILVRYTSCQECGCQVNKSSSLPYTQARMRQVGAGLGSQGSSYGVYSSSGSYKETLKNLTKARYEEMFTD